MSALKAPIMFLVLTCLLSMPLITLLPTSGREELDRSGLGLRGVFKKLGELPPKVARSLKVMYVNGLVNGFAMGILLPSHT